MEFYINQKGEIRREAVISPNRHNHYYTLVKRIYQNEKFLTQERLECKKLEIARRVANKWINFD
jgi:hypothetical protein